MKIMIYDNFCDNPIAYKSNVLNMEFKSIPTEAGTFHGIAEIDSSISSRIQERLYMEFTSATSIIRKSPLNQVEPNYIHTDLDMGDYTAILFLNENPPENDGTVFWKHKETGAINGNLIGDAGKDLSLWEEYYRVQSKFNRLVLFPSSLFHSRSIPENYGTDEDARLIQVTFLKV